MLGVHILDCFFCDLSYLVLPFYYPYILYVFGLSTGVPRHSAGGVGTYIHIYVVRIICNAHE